jgi:hypothetical protein
VKEIKAASFIFRVVNYAVFYLILISQDTMKKFTFLLILTFLIWPPIIKGQSTNTILSKKNNKVQQDSLISSPLYGSIQAQVVANTHPIATFSTYPAFPEHTQSAAALTGPGKVVVCIMALCGLVFYFNRKK